MEDKKFEQLMNELRKTCKKLNRSSYEFRKKAMKMQYAFNLGVKESISSAQREQTRVAQAVDLEWKESLKKAADYLEEGVSTSKMLQKHIKVADCLDYGWEAVCHYP